jgi:hypothetical protein
VALKRNATPNLVNRGGSDGSDDSCGNHGIYDNDGNDDNGGTKLLLLLFVLLLQPRFR